MITSSFRIGSQLLVCQNVQSNCFNFRILKVVRHASSAPVYWQSSRSSAAQRRAVDAYPGNPSWKPGLEPGLDPARSNDGSQESLLDAECHITVVDYSEDRIEKQHLDNKSLPKWIESQGKRADWAKCRWINVDGLSWDVIQALGRYKNLHKLAIEDLVNTENRTKADWYTDHTYIVLTLQKLVHAYEDGDGKSGNQIGRNGLLASEPKGRMRKFLHNLFAPREMPHHDEAVPQAENKETSYTASNDGFIFSRTGSHVQRLRRLQGYRSDSDPKRWLFMERNSVLGKKNLVVCAEQVSIFLLSDNTVISFFEASAEDVEIPVCARLANSDTVLRQSCDASLLTQSIIDTIVDLAIPVSAAYQGAIETLELEVLTKPSITHAKDLYMITSEITAMRNFITPIRNLIINLEDERSGRTSSPAVGNSLKPSSAVKISSLTRTYLRDVEDHCVLILQTLEQISASAKGMIDLIFHTISATQNETMKQLTAATIMFLPLTFITGYFGMNLTDFPSLENNERFFWYIATPVATGTALLLVHGKLRAWVSQLIRTMTMKRKKKRHV